MRTLCGSGPTTPIPSPATPLPTSRPTSPHPFLAQTWFFALCMPCGAGSSDPAPLPQQPAPAGGPAARAPRPRRAFGRLWHASLLRSHSLPSTTGSRWVGRFRCRAGAGGCWQALQAGGGGMRAHGLQLAGALVLC